MKYPLAEMLKEGYLRDCSKNAIITEQERDKWLQESLEYFQDNPEEYFYYATSGNSLVMAHKAEGEIHLWDAKLIRAATLVWEDSQNEATI